MKPALIPIVLLLSLSTSNAEELSRPAEKLLESALRTARGSRVRDRQVEKLLETAAELSDEELRAVVDALRAETSELTSLDTVRALFVTSYLKRRYGDGVAERFPDLLDRMESEDPGVRTKLLGESLRMEDLRLARELAVRDQTTGVAAIRVRAALSLGSLVAWGEASPEIRYSLSALLDDADPGVRAAAIRAGFLARFDPVYPAAVEHLDDGAQGEAEIDGAVRKLRPGEEALNRLRELTRIDVDLTWEEFHALSEDEKRSVTSLFTAFWKQKGGALPPPGFREAVFRSVPSKEDSKILPSGETTARFQFWAGMDRTRIRATLDEIEVFATGPLDWEAHFHLRYMAQGMRVDDGEGYVRNHPVGSRYVLARKAIGCYVLAFQPLFDGRVKVRLWFHDPV